MTVQNSLISLMLTRFEGGFVAQMSSIVVHKGLIDQLYDLSVGRFDKWGLNSTQIEQIIFRSAYVLEYVYFNHKALFNPLADRFITDFPHTKNASAKRHFAKIMADFLSRGNVIEDQSKAEAVAQSAALWAIATDSRVAVRIWGVDVLIALRNCVDWVDDALNDIFETMSREPSPALLSRMRKWRKRVSS